jgi:hypothetical protein
MSNYHRQSCTYSAGVLYDAVNISTTGPRPGKGTFHETPTLYRTIQVDGLSIFYREAGPKDAPTLLLLLHGLPSSSRMFESLFSRLSDRYHLVAPDYPGFGHSDWPAQNNSCTRSITSPKP